MNKLYKLVVTGPFNAGKTTFVNSLANGGGTVNTDRMTSRDIEAQIKAHTTVALDYGKVTLGQNVNVHLFGTPGQERFDFMRDLLAEGMHGFFFLIDATDRAGLRPAARLLAQFRRRNNVPFLLVANKADRQGMSSAEIRNQLNVPQAQPVVSCVATDHRSVRAAAEQLVALIEAGG